MTKCFQLYDDASNNPRASQPLPSVRGGDEAFKKGGAPQSRANPLITPNVDDNGITINDVIEGLGLKSLCAGPGTMLVPPPEQEQTMPHYV